MVSIQYHKKVWYPFMVMNSALGTRVPGQGCYLLNQGWSFWHPPDRAGDVNFSEHPGKKGSPLSPLQMWEPAESAPCSRCPAQPVPACMVSRTLV